jgi:hypothetical protein
MFKYLFKLRKLAALRDMRIRYMSLQRSWLTRSLSESDQRIVDHCNAESNEAAMKVLVIETLIKEL